MHAMRVGGAMLPVLLLIVLLFAAPADAEPRIKVSGCKVYATHQVDPIAFTDHLHRHFGNRSRPTGLPGQASSTEGPLRAKRTGSPWRGQCPRSHPYRIPKINYLIRHPNTDGKVTKPLRVSAGANSWAKYTSMHGDYFAANQDVFNKLIDLCLRNAPDSVTVADPRCGEEP